MYGFFVNIAATDSRRQKAYTRDTQIDYENVSLPVKPASRYSDAIPVEKLKWYIESNAELISHQYKVCEFDAVSGFFGISRHF